MDEVIPPNVNRFGQSNHRKNKPGASRGAGECTLSVGSRCPRLESVRREYPLQPTPRCREAAGIRFRGGVGLRPAGLMLRQRDLQQQAHLSIQNSSTAAAVPLLLQGEGLNALEEKQDLRCPGNAATIRSPEFGSVAPVRVRLAHFRAR